MNWCIVMMDEPEVVSPQLTSLSSDIFFWTCQHFEIIQAIHSLPLTQEFMMQNSLDVKKTSK
jgi:hypothetical protein